MKKRLQCERLCDRECPAVFGNPWLHPDLTLSFVPDGTLVGASASEFETALGNIPAEQRTDEVLRAFQSWIAVANVNVGLVGDGGQPVGAPGTAFGDARFGDIRVSAVPLAHENVALAYPYDATAGTRSGDITFNSTHMFQVGAGAGYDLFSISLHEAGHIFGLTGSTDETSAMFQIADRVRTGPNATDIAAIQALYGPRLADGFEGESGNNSLATAARPQPVEEIIAIEADLTTSSDVDVYSFRPDDLDGGAFLASVRSSGLSLLVPSIEILDASGAVIASQSTSRPGAGDLALRLTGLVEGDTYYARITAANPTFAVGGYRLELRAESATPGDDDDLDDPEEGEDDSPETSDSLDRLPAQTGTRRNFFVASSLSTLADADFYRVRSGVVAGESGGALTVSAVATDGDRIQPVLEIYDRNLVRLAARTLVHDGGEFSAQLPDTEANRDYYIAVRHGRRSIDSAGNYSLGIDFGGQSSELGAIAGGTLTSPAPAVLSRIEVPASQVLHVVLDLESTAVPSAVRMSVFDANHALIDTRIADSGESASFNAYLSAGTYQFLVGGGSLDGSAMPEIRYSVFGGSISDPVGPQAVPATTPPPPPPPATVTNPHPVTPTVAVTPTSPNILLVPPTDLPTAPTLQIRPAAPLPTTTITVGGASSVRSYASDGSLRVEFNPIPDRTGPFRTAVADFNDDGVADIAVGSGPGTASAVRIFDGRTLQPLPGLDPFEASFLGGVFVAAGDLTGDGIADLVVTPDEGGGPRVRVWRGPDFTLVADFFGIDDSSFRGGARAAVGDVNADGFGDLIVAAGFAGGPRIAGYDGVNLNRGLRTKIFSDFFAFEETLRNGVYLVAADLNGDGFAEVVAGGGPGGGPRVLALDGRDLRDGRRTTVADFFGGDPASRDGIRLAAKNLDGDGFADLVVAAGDRALGYSGRTAQPFTAPDILLEIPLLSGNDLGVFVG